MDDEVSVLLKQSEDILDSSENYEEIDMHALNTPEDKKKSIESLASYLTEPARNDREKARAIYRWVAENIDYDVQGLFHGSYGDTSPEGVLRSGKSVCSGYSGLFDSLANASGLEVVTISGYAKGYDYIPGMNFSGPTDHAWNAIKLNGTWYLLDSTWGAGGLVNGKYIRKFDDHYFLTSPEEFVYDHLPEDPKWQLLDKPLSKEEFERLVYLKSEFFNLGMQLGNQINGTINTDVEANVSLYVPEDVLIMAKLARMGQDAAFRKDYGEATLVQRKGDQYVIQLLPPSPGEYILTVFAKRKSEEGGYWEAAEYKVKEVSGSNRSFPIVFDEFFDMGLMLENQTNGTIEAKGMANITLYAPEDILMIASLEKAGKGASSSKDRSTSTFVQRSGDKYAISLLSPASGEYILKVFAKRENEDGSYWEVARYNVLALSGSKTDFPETFGDFHEKEAHLYTPLTGELKAALNQTFKLKIPTAEDAAVISGESWYHLTKSGDIFHGEAVLKKGEIDVAARFPGKSEYSTLVRYRGI